MANDTPTPDLFSPTSDGDQPTSGPCPQIPNAGDPGKQVTDSLPDASLSPQNDKPVRKQKRTLSTQYVRARREALKARGVVRIECEVTDDGNMALVHLSRHAGLSKSEFVAVLIKRFVERNGFKW